MKRKMITYFILLLLTWCLPNCATIIHGSKQDVVIVSDPKKANINIDGNNVGQTPYRARLTRKNKHIVKVDIDGYIPYDITLKKKFDGWIFGNIIFGGIIGIVVDAATGSMYVLSPKDVSAELKSNSSAFSKTKDGIYLAVVLKPKNNWNKIGQLEKSSF